MVRLHNADARSFIRGDYFTAVFCYCEYPQKMEEVMGPAHFYQFEYYNKHHDTTFILTSACPDGDIGFDMFCVPPGGGTKVLTGGTMTENCKLWDGYESIGDRRIPRTDLLCYMPQYHHHMDYLAFNHQKRNLGSRGKQCAANGHLEPGTCENLCQENMDMPVLRDDKFPPSHQVEWTCLDDMCDHCK